jgi:hypothetical protein
MTLGDYDLEVLREVGAGKATKEVVAGGQDWKSLMDALEYLNELGYVRLDSGAGYVLTEAGKTKLAETK